MPTITPIEESSCEALRGGFGIRPPAPGSPYYLYYILGQGVNTPDYGFNASDTGASFYVKTPAGTFTQAVPPVDVAGTF